MAKQWEKKENKNIIEKTKEILGQGINNAAKCAAKCLKKMSDTANNINKSTANLYDGMFNPNKKNKTNSNTTNKANHKIPTNSQKNKGGFGNMVNKAVGKAVGEAKKFVDDKIAPWLATEGSIKGKFIDYTNANGINAGIIKAQTDCLQKPNSKQCKVETRTINNQIEQANLQNQGLVR